MIYLVRTQDLETGRPDLEYHLHADKLTIISPLSSISAMAKSKIVPAL